MPIFLAAGIVVNRREPSAPHALVSGLYSCRNENAAVALFEGYVGRAFPDAHLREFEMTLVPDKTVRSLAQARVSDLFDAADEADANNLHVVVHAD